MKRLIFIRALFIAFSAHAQYVRNGQTITTEDLNIRAQKLTQQCVYLHIASLSSEGLGVILISVAVGSAATNNGYGRHGGYTPDGGLIAAGSIALIAGPILGIVEWIKVAQAHNILSLGNPKISFNSDRNGLGLAYNF